MFHQEIIQPIQNWRVAWFLPGTLEQESVVRLNVTDRLLGLTHKSDWSILLFLIKCQHEDGYVRQPWCCSQFILLAASKIPAEVTSGKPVNRQHKGGQRDSVVSRRHVQNCKTTGMNIS